MAIEAELIRIKPQDLEKLMNSPDFNLLCIINYREVGQDDFWLGIYWQMIHYILTGEVGWPGRSFLPAPLCNILLGGKLLYSEDTICYLNPSEVKEVAEFLKEHSVSWVEKEFYRVKYRPVLIYRAWVKKEDGWMDEDDLPEILSNYECLCSIYFEAAEAGDAMLIQID
jgi:Domain of unknown function (DUF1877)